MTFIAILVLIPFLVVTGFVFVFSVKHLLAAGAWCPWYVKAIAYVWLVLGGIADVLFNIVWGSLIFRELPKLPHELTMTARVRRHFAKGSGWRQAKAAKWASMLNAVDPGHV